MKQLITDLDSIINYVNQVGSDCIKVFGGDFEGGYCLEQCPLEISKFILFLKDYKIENYMEIGIAAAGLTRLLTDYFDLKNITTIDIPYQKVLKERKINLDYISQITNLNALDANSRSRKAKKFLEEINIKYDLIFIDGGHNYLTVKNDIELALKYSKKNTLICLHDIYFSDGGPRKVYGEYKLHPNIRDVLTIEDKHKGIGILQYVAD